MLILGIVVLGMSAGGLAQLAMGKSMFRINWSMALTAGLLGSFVGGLLGSLLLGDGLKLRPSGLIGSTVGAILLTVVWVKYDQSKQAKASGK